MAALSPESAKYAKGFLSPLKEGQDHDNFFNTEYQNKPHSYDRFMRPAWGTDEYKQFKDSGQTSFIGDNNMPDFNLSTGLSDLWGGLTTFGSNLPQHNTLGSKAAEHNTILGGFGYGNMDPNAAINNPGLNLQSTHADNTANAGYLGGGNSMGLNGENPMSPWSDGEGSYGTGDGQTWHTDDYDWNGNSDGDSDGDSGGGEDTTGYGDMGDGVDTGDGESVGVASFD